MKVGERIYMSTGGDREYLCEIVSFDDGCVKAGILDVYGSNRELPVNITLYQAIAKGDKMETVIQKAVELGAARIVPVITDRVIVKLDDKKKDKKKAKKAAKELAIEAVEVAEAVPAPLSRSRVETLPL